MTQYLFSRNRPVLLTYLTTEKRLKLRLRYVLVLQRWTQCFPLCIATRKIRGIAYITIRRPGADTTAGVKSLQYTYPVVLVVASE